MKDINVDRLIQEVEDLISSSQYINIKGLYNCQKEALRRVFERYSSEGYVSGIIQMPTGTGKTVLAASIILTLWKYYSIIGKKRLLAVFLAPRIVIKRQAYEKFKNILFYGSRKTISVIEVKGSKELCDELSEYFDQNRVNRIKTMKQNLVELLEKFPSLKKIYPQYSRQNNLFNKDYTEGLVIIATPQLIHRLLNGNRDECIATLMNNIDILIMDEIHTFYIGDEIIKTINRLVRSRTRRIPIIIGLTATPVREACALLGGLIYHKFSSDAMREGILTPSLKIIKYRTIITNLRPIYTDDKTSPSWNEWKYAIKERAEKYAEIIVSELSKIRAEAGLPRYPKTLVVATNTTEANLLKEEIERLVKQETRVLVAHYKVEESDPHDIIEEFKNYETGILITVNMADIGFDDPDLEVLVLARPITNAIAYVQLRGRILRKPRSINNLKNLKKYALIIDLVGKRDLIELEKHHIKFVELGLLEKKSLATAISELRGGDIAPVASANVNVKRESESTIGEPIESDKVAEISKTSLYKKTIEQFLERLKEMYKIEIERKKRTISICRSTKYTNDCQLIPLELILSSGVIRQNKEEIRSKVGRLIRDFVQRYIHYDIKAINEEDIWDKSSEEVIINKFINMLIDTAVNEIIKLGQRGYVYTNIGKKHKKKKTNEDLNEISKNVLISYLYNVIHYGAISFKYRRCQVRLYKAKRGTRYYIMVVLENRRTQYIKITQYERMAETLLNILQTCSKS